MNAAIADCSGTPFNFQPEYSTAGTANQGGRAAANVNVAHEIGHFTPARGSSTSTGAAQAVSPSRQPCPHRVPQNRR